MSEERAERCETCRFWNRTMLRGENDGECRHGAPGAYHQAQVKEPLQIDASGQQWFSLRMVETPFPPMFAGQWCGKYEDDLDARMKGLDQIESVESVTARIFRKDAAP